MDAIESADSIFVPVLPLLEAEAEAAGDTALEEAKGEDQGDDGSVGGGSGGGGVTSTPEGGVLVTLSGAADEGASGGRCLQVRCL